LMLQERGERGATVGNCQTAYDVQPHATSLLTHLKGFTMQGSTTTTSQSSCASQQAVERPQSLGAQQQAVLATQQQIGASGLGRSLTLGAVPQHQPSCRMLRSQSWPHHPVQYHPQPVSTSFTAPLAVCHWGSLPSGLASPGTLWMQEPPNRPVSSAATGGANTIETDVSVQGVPSVLTSTVQGVPVPSADCQAARAYPCQPLATSLSSDLPSQPCFNLQQAQLSRFVTASPVFAQPAPASLIVERCCCVFPRCVCGGSGAPGTLSGHPYLHAQGSSLLAITQPGLHGNVGLADHRGLLQNVRLVDSHGVVSPATEPSRGVVVNQAGCPQLYLATNTMSGFRPGNTVPLPHVINSSQPPVANHFYYNLQ
jgi:hypothetical protein